MAQYAYTLIARGAQLVPPVNFQQVDTKPYGVRSEVSLMQDGNYITVAQNSAALPGSVTNVGQRLGYSQAWDASWSMEGWLDHTGYDFLKLLRDTATPFWLQYDDEMTRDTPLLLLNPSKDLQTFLTPTYPIFPYQVDPPITTQNHTAIYLNGSTTPINQGAYPFTFSNEYGIIHFTSPLPSNSIITMSYSWRAYVLITKFQMQTTSASIANHIFIGNVTFTQLPFPVTDTDWWNFQLPNADLGF
jgi:hypothetical protein